MILLLNGPNLSQIGSRRPAIYGSQTLDDIVAGAREEHPELQVFTTESEADLITRLHRARTDGTRGIVINPGALTHYSYAVRDALEMLDVPKVEVHLSQTAAREDFRSTSVISPVVDVTITGARAYGYRMAVRAVLHLLGDEA